MNSQVTFLVIMKINRFYLTSSCISYIENRGNLVLRHFIFHLQFLVVLSIKWRNSSAHIVILPEEQMTPIAFAARCCGSGAGLGRRVQYAIKQRCYNKQETKYKLKVIKTIINLICF